MIAAAGVYGKIGGMASRSELSIHHIIALLLRSVLKRLPDCAGVQKLKSGTLDTCFPQNVAKIILS